MWTLELTAPRECEGRQCGDCIALDEPCRLVDARVRSARAAHPSGNGGRHLHLVVDSHGEARVAV